MGDEEKASAEERARIDSWFTDDTDALSCRKCGAVVPARPRVKELHVNWHEQLHRRFARE